MISEVFNLAAVQMSATIGARAENLEKAVCLLDEAVRRGALLVTLPELFATGYFSHTGHVDPAYFDLAEPLDGPTMSTMCEYARTNRVWLNVPHYERTTSGDLYNSSVLVDSAGEIVGVYRKTHLPWSLTGWEKFYMRPGSGFPVLETPLGRVGILLCYDRDFPEAARILALRGAELILLPNGASRSLVEMWQKVVSVRAYENQVAILGCSLTGRTDVEHHEFCGHSLYASPTGDILGSLGFEEGVLVVEHDRAAVESARRTRFMSRDRRPELYGDVAASLPIHQNDTGK